MSDSTKHLCQLSIVREKKIYASNLGFGVLVKIDRNLFVRDIFPLNFWM